MKTLNDLLGKRVAVLSERAANDRKSQAKCRVITKPTKDNLFWASNPGLATLENPPDDRNIFDCTVIIDGTEYVGLGSASWIENGKPRDEFTLAPLIPPLRSNLRDEVHHRSFVIRSGTNERYALGETVYWRDGKIHKTPAPWP